MSCKFGEVDEEYAEDLILLNYEQSSIYHVNRKSEGLNNSNGPWRFNEDILLNPTLRRLCTSPISTSIAPKIYRSLSVKIIDCGKFPWYFKRYKHQIVNKMKYLQPIAIPDSDTDDDCIIFGDTGGKVSIRTNSDCPTNKVVEEFPNMQREKKRISMKRLQRIKRREEIELQRALNQKNKNSIDFKRNKGLVGLTITRKISVNDVAPEATIDKPKQDTEKMEHITSDTTYFNIADKMLSSCGTDLIAVIEYSETSATIKDKKANEIINNAVSGSDKRTDTSLSNNSSNMSVKCTIDKDKKQRKDNSKKKMGHSAEIAAKRDDELKKVKKSASIVEKDSSSQLKTNIKSRSNVKDAKKTNKYVNEQIKKRTVENANRHNDKQQKYVSIHQTNSNQDVKIPVSQDLNTCPETKKGNKKSNQDVQKLVSQDLNAAPEPKKDTKKSNQVVRKPVSQHLYVDAETKEDKKSTNTTEKNTKGFGNGSSSPILTCNSIVKKHKPEQNITSKRTNHYITQHASNKITTDKISSKRNKVLQNITTQNILKTSPNEDKRKTGQNESFALPDEIITPNKLHYYSLSYQETKNKNTVNTQNTDESQIKNIDTRPKNSNTQNRPLNNSLDKCPIQILSVDRINNIDKISKKSQLPSVGDDNTYRLPEGPLNEPSQNDTTLKQQNIMQMSTRPHTSAKPPKHATNYSFSNVKNRKPAVPNYQSDPRFAQPIQTYVTTRPMLPHYVDAPPHREATPQKIANTSFMHINCGCGLCSNSSVYHHTTFRSPREPVIPSVTVQSPQDIYPRPINSNLNQPNYNVPNNMFRGYGNNSLPHCTLFSSQPSPPLTPRPSFHSPQHSSQPTPIQSNPSRNERSLLICDNNIIKMNAPTAPEPPNVHDGGQVSRVCEPKSPNNNYFKTPASIILETLEPVECKIKMLEELDKVTIEDEFAIHLKRPHDVTVSPKVKENILNTPKYDPQPKRAKTDEKKGVSNQKSKNCPTLPLKGYSPPILPIPGTLEEILKKVKSEPQAEKGSRHVNTDANPKIFTENAKKISLDEYKKRTYANDGTDYSPNKEERKHGKCKHGQKSSATHNRNHSIDSDLGYDSDSTMIL